jgi:hypothetical protein
MRLTYAATPARARPDNAATASAHTESRPPNRPSLRPSPAFPGLRSGGRLPLPRCAGPSEGNSGVTETLISQRALSDLSIIPVIWLIVPGMENTPNWMFWLLVGLAVIPMLIPAQRRYQVLRLRLTAARLRSSKNTARPWLSFKKKRSPYLPIPIPRGMTALHPEPRGNSRIWFVLAIQLLIAIPLLVVFAGAVYYRIAIETFRSSVLFDPGETGRGSAPFRVHYITVAQLFDNRRREDRL